MSYVQVTMSLSGRVMDLILALINAMLLYTV